MAVNPFYREMQKAARDLISYFNQDSLDVVLQVVTPNVDPLLPPTIVATEQRYEAVASGMSGQARANDPVIANCDYRVIVDVEQGYRPEVGTLVKIDGRSCLIKRVEPIPAMGPICAYRFYAEA